jgi:iron complex transport system ATP-binding protein
MGMNRPATLIETHQLTVGYGGSSAHVLFEHLNLTLNRGELVCFMGPNGIGKSTLIRTLAGLQKPLSGEILYNKERHVELEKFLSVVLTDKPSAGYLTAEELVSFGRYPYLNWLVETGPAHLQVIEQAMAVTHTLDLRHRRISELSDGQFQLVMIARALTQQTPLMLLDEPTAHLDLNNRVDIMNLLKKIARELHKGILIATHELDLALQTADTVWLAGKNKEIITGIPEDLVLRGVFDDIFRFKGFDLKTGKVVHVPWRNERIALEGSGPELLWTKNALERCGYTIVAEAPTTIRVINNQGNISWVLDNSQFDTLGELLSAFLGE